MVNSFLKNQSARYVLHNPDLFYIIREHLYCANNLQRDQCYLFTWPSAKNFIYSRSIWNTS